MNRRWLSRNSRYAVPAAIVAVIAMTAATVAATAAAAPQLPRRTAAQLLASIAQARLPRAFTATVTETAALGIPDLPSVGGLSSPASLLSGTHTVSIWYAGPRQVRLAVPVSFGESDLRVNGSQAWLWDSRRQTATHIVGLPAPGDRMRGQPAGSPDRSRTAGPDGQALTPLAMARKLLAAISPTTAVSVGSAVTVAGRAAYELTIAPRTAGSLVGQVRIAVDARLGLPLRLAIYPRGAASPAFETGFSALSLGQPAPANFSFRPPPGTTIRTSRLPGPGAGWAGLAPLAGAGPWAGGPAAAPRLAPGGSGAAAGLPRVATPFPAALRRCLRHPVRLGLLAPKRLSQLQPGARRARLAGQVRCERILFGLRPVPGWRPLPGAGARVLGTGWLSVLVLPGGTASPPAMLRAAVPVHGSWGSGRLLRTALFSVLITSKGTVLVGAVTPAVLYADAARVQ